MDEEAAANVWHLDKRVPIGLLLMMVAQTILFVYFGTSWKDQQDHRIENLEKSEERVVDAPNRITILEQQFSFIQDTLRRIEVKVDKKDTP